MNLVIPFTSDIKFDSTIGEILSVSLEHDYTVNTGEVLGNFTVSGEYKVHEISINKEVFKYVVPFSVEITEDIDPDTVDFEVENFTYEVVDSNTLRINIEYNIKADIVKQEMREVELLEPVETREEVVEEPRVEEQVEEVGQVEVKESEEESNVDKEINITNNNINSNDTFITYNIHIMTDTDTIDAVCTKYNTTKDVLEEYNDLSTVVTGDKIIIPSENE